MINLIFKRDELLKALDYCSSSIEKKHPNVILTHILFDFKDSECTLNATNLETVVVAKTHLLEPVQEGKIAVSALYIINICRLAIGDEVVFIYDDENNVLNVRSGKSEYKVPCPDASDFPPIPETTKEFKTIEIGKIISAFRKVQFSMSDIFANKAYSGVLITKTKEDDGSESIEFVTTDIHRLSALKLKNFNMNFDEMGTGEVIPGKSFGIVIPGKNYTEMNKIFANSNEAEMTIDDEKLFVRKDDVMFISRLIKNEFPNHRPIIGTYETLNSKEFAVINRKDLIEAIKRVIVLSSEEKIWASKYFFNGNVLKMEANSNSGGSSTDEIIIEKGFSTERSVAVNAKYFLDVIGVIDDNCVNIIVEDDKSRPKPMIVKEENEEYFYVHMIMPLRI
ncbi:DNA polymerase III subunit beta [bacterium]|nr:DNA polymerase III subunit beta [bacterium]